MLALLIGFIAGFITAVPIAGPVAVLVLRDALAGKKNEARQIALGSAIAEAIYAGIAFAGIGAAFERFPILLPISQTASAIILVVVGVYLIVRHPKEKAEGGSRKPVPARAKWLVGLSITALNPTLIASWTAIVAALHGAGAVSSHPVEALPFALGIGLGNMSWFMMLLALVGKYREKLSPGVVRRGVQIVGGILAAAGVVMGVRTALAFLG